MSGQLEMQRIQNEELRKVRMFRKWNYHGFAFPNEIDGVRERLKLSGVKYRTEKVFELNKLIGYKVFVA